MIIRIAQHFIDTDDIYIAEFATQDDKLHAHVVLSRQGRWDELNFSEGPAEYLQSVLDTFHMLSIQQLRDAVPVFN